MGSPHARPAGMDVLSVPKLDRADAARNRPHSESKRELQDQIHHRPATTWSWRNPAERL
jgi:hypothetical protein